MLKRKSSAGRPPARPGSATLAGRLEHPATHEHALEVRRRQFVAERRRVDVSQLSHRERLRREREADVRVRQLRPQPLTTGERDLAVVEGELRQSVDRVPVRVLGQRRIDAERHDAEVGRGQLPFARVALRLAAGLELLEVGELRGRRPSRRGACGSTARASRPARGSRPGGTRRPPERILRALPEEHLQLPRAHLEHDREGHVCRFGRLRHSFRLTV